MALFYHFCKNYYYMKKIYSFIGFLFLFVCTNNAFAQPSNDNPCFALPLTVVYGTLLDEPCTTGTMYNHIGATASTVTYAAGSGGCYAGQPDVWFSVVVPSTGNIMLNTSEATASGNSPDLTMGVYAATVCSGTFTLLACNDDGGDANIGSYNPIIRISGRTPGEILFIRIRNLPVGVSNFSFRLCAKNLGAVVPPPISFSGFVGIGNATPEGHLDVNGDVLIRRDFYVGRNSNFSGNATFNGNLTFNKNLTINQDATFKGKIVVEDSLISQGYTRLGAVADAAPKIKMKEFNTTSNAIFNGQSAINHGLNSAKIISVTVLLEWTTGYLVPPEYSPDPLLNYNYFVSPSQIIIQNNAATCAYICSKPVKILVTYKE
jgi:hypothetical protein